MSKKRNIILRGRSRVYRTAFLFAVSIVMTGLYAHIYVSVLGLDLPKTAILKKKNAEWCSKIEVLDRHLDECDATLSALQMRDDDIYRSIFGMNEIPAEVRNAGFGGVNRYAHYTYLFHSGSNRNYLNHSTCISDNAACHHRKNQNIYKSRRKDREKIKQRHLLLHHLFLLLLPNTKII